MRSLSPLPGPGAALLFACFLSLLTAVGCTDPITVGSELLEDDRTDVGETTDIPITTRVVRDDSLFIFDGNRFAFPAPFTFGQLQGPVFGTTTHSVYLTPRLPRDRGTNLPILPPFAQRVDISIDSIVVLLPIDTAKALYGPGRSFPVRATTVTEPVSFSDDFYSNLSLPTDGIDISEQSDFKVTTRAQLVRDTAVAGRDIRRPHVRIRLNASAVDRFNRLTVDDFGADSLFRQEFAGLYLEPAGASDALLGVAINEDSGTDTLYNGFNIYYRDTTDRPAVYRIGFLQALPNYSYDYGGSLIGELLEAGEDPELLAIAGQGGLLTEVAFDDLSILEDRVINKATLTLPLTTVEGYDYSNYPPVGRVEILYRPTPTSGLAFIEEASALRRASVNQEAIYDAILAGKLADTNDEQRAYSPNFSIHLQRIIDGEVPPRIYLRATPLPGDRFAFRPARSLIAGPQNSDGPRTLLSVTFTELD